MQLTPVVEINNAKAYDGIDIDTQANGMMTYVCAKNVPSYRMTTSFRLTAASANQSKFFMEVILQVCRKRKPCLMCRLK